MTRVERHAKQLKRGSFPGANRGEQGTLEPAAMLITALQIQIGRPLQLGSFLNDGSMARSRIKPDIENIVFLDKLASRTF